jgi:F-type H+-transporting ATPase subunit O
MLLSTISQRAGLSLNGRRFSSALAAKYSGALYSAALSKSPQQLTKVQAELTAISSALSSSPELSAFIGNPTLSLRDRTAGLNELYAAAGKKEQITDMTKNFFAVLSENGRLGETKGTIDGFNQLVAKYKGELEVTVTSAQPLPADVQKRLETTLKQSQTAQKAKSIKITNKVCAVLDNACVPCAQRYR